MRGVWYLNPAMDMNLEGFGEEFRRLVAENRGQCLWFAREDYCPDTIPDMLRVLDQIRRHGNLIAFRRAGELKQWLLRYSSGMSAG